MPANQSTPEVTRALKPCPKCDDVGELRTSSDGEIQWVRCKLCGHESPLAYGTAEAIDGWNAGLSRAATPARGGDELREALEKVNAIAEGMQEAFARLSASTRYDGEDRRRWTAAMEDAQEIVELSSIASTDMAGAGERAAIVAFLRRQSDIGANRGNEAEKGTTKRAAYGGGSLALHRAADAIEAGEHLTNDNTAAPPVEGLTSGEGWQIVPVEPADPMLLAGCAIPGVSLSTGRRMWSAMLAASPKATATASVRECSASPDHADIMETIENAADDWQAKGYASALAEVRDMANVGRALMDALPEGYHYMNCPSEIVSDFQNQLSDLKTFGVTDSGTAATIGGKRA